MGAFGTRYRKQCPPCARWKTWDNGAVARPGSGWEVNGGGVKATVIYALDNRRCVTECYLNRKEYKSASFNKMRSRTVHPASLLTSSPPFHFTVRSSESPKIAGQSAAAKPGMGFPSAS